MRDSWLAFIETDCGERRGTQMPEAHALCGQGPIDQQGQRDGTHAEHRRDKTARHDGRLSDEGVDLLRLGLRHGFLRVLWDQAIHGGNYNNTIEILILINFIYSIGLVAIGASGGRQGRSLDVCAASRLLGALVS
jgi:hypothetical protein